MTIFYQILFLVLTYFVAAIPFGLVISKWFAGKDIRQMGSKNIGATNVTRILGKKLGFLTLILDGLKGAVMVMVAKFNFYDINNLHIFLVLVGAVAVAAHVYPIYLGFKGGKGVATAIAVLLTLDLSVGFLVICFWIMSFSLFRISAVASLIATFSSIIFSSLYDAPTEQIIFCWFLFALIAIRHKENIVRLLTGEEKKL
jgi:acyl phosphate:glycerol-3-phosphate acyltransferase